MEGEPHEKEVSWVLGVYTVLEKAIPCVTLKPRSSRLADASGHQFCCNMQKETDMYRCISNFSNQKWKTRKAFEFR